jgi:alcohol dehydrogenase
VAAILELGGWHLETFFTVESNPRASTVEELASQIASKGSCAVIGLGGGSVLDAAKAAAMLATNGGGCRDYEGANRFTRSPLPFIALPTTCGTGSEVTWVSVISLPEERVKISVKGHDMFPAVALVDSDLVTTLPSHLVAWTGLDALTHALEALTVKLANPASDALATRAVELLLRYLRRAVADIAGDGEAREAVMTASTLAGMAFGNADVGAVHCLSESLGGLYDVPHGLANALLLVPVLRSHGKCIETPLARLAGAVLPAAALPREASAQTAAFLEAVEALVAALDLPPFADFGIPPSDAPRIARGAVANGSNPSNPRSMDEAEYLEILQGLL